MHARKGPAWAVAAALALAAGCGTERVMLPRNNRLTPAQAVPVIEQAVRRNALQQAPGAAAAAPRAWADAEGWVVPEDGRLAKLYYADILSVSRTYAGGDDVAASACLAGLMGPFSAARVEVTMKDGTVRRFEADPGGDPAVCLNCAPFWLVTFPRPIRKARLIGLSFETMRVQAGVSALPPP